MLKRIETLIAGTRGPVVVALLAFALSLPALRLGLQADDHILAWQVEHGEPPWSLLHAGDSMLRQGRDTGAIAWWASPNLSVDFFRPIASLTHYVDFRVWPGAPWLMLLINALIYSACAYTATFLYRVLAPNAAAASIAALMFAVDEAHAQSVGWISGRNTILALLGSLVALLWQARAHQQQRRSLNLASALSVLFALLSAEAGAWSLAYVIAYALTMQTGSLPQRMRSIVPQLSVGALWAAVYVAGDFGLRGSSWYRELSSPLTALGQGLLDLPLSITSVLGPSLIALAILQPADVARIATLPVAALLLWLVWPPRDDKSGRFFALAAALCLLPTFLTVPQDRLLMGSSLGAFGWIAGTVVRGENASGLRERIGRRLMLVLHLGLSPLLFVVMLGAQHGFENGTQALIRIVQPRRDVILLNSPLELLSNYVGGTLDRAGRRQHMPNALHQLYAGGSELWVTRIDERTIDVSATRGWGFTAVERIFCTPNDMPRVGSIRHARNLSVEVIRTTESGMPATVRFRFPTALESPERQWLIWRDAAPVAWSPPKLGARSRIAPLNLFAALPP